MFDSASSIYFLGMFIGIITTLCFVGFVNNRRRIGKLTKVKDSEGITGLFLELNSRMCPDPMKLKRGSKVILVVDELMDAK